MTIDELEFSISQYVDGVLPPVETAALEERLATDPDARNILSEYERLNATIKADRALPDLDWDQLTARIADAVAQEEPPVRNYAMKWPTWTARGALAGGALAAALLLAAGVFFRVTNDQGPIAGGPNAASTGVAVVEGPKIEVAAAGTKAVEVSIGPADEAAELYSRYADTIVSRPSHVMIASGIDENATPTHDGPMMPY